MTQVECHDEKNSSLAPIYPAVRTPLVFMFIFYFSSPLSSPPLAPYLNLTFLSFLFSLSQARQWLLKTGERCYGVVKGQERVRDQLGDRVRII